MRTIVFYLSIVGFASGIFLRSFFDIGLPTLTLVLMIAVAVLVVTRQTRATLSIYISLVLLAGSLGVLRLEVATWYEVVPELEAQLGTEVVISAIVTREPDVRTRSQHLYVTLETINTDVLVIHDRYQTINYGDLITVSGVLEQPQSFTTDLGRTFDYPGYLQAQGVRYMIRYPDSVAVTDTARGNALISVLLTAKEQFQNSVRRYIVDPHVGLAEGLLLGEKQALGAEWSERFRRTGIIHIVVLSGYNVMLVIGFFVFVLSWFCSLRTRVVGALIGVVCFALIVGLSATVVRASIMASLLLLALLFGRTYAIMRALLLAGAIMLILNPYLLIFDPGFQLSFLATLGLIVVAPYFEARLVVPERIVTVRDYVIATTATQIAVLPLLLYQIGELSLVAILVNVLVLPMVPIAMLLTFITGLFGMVSVTLGSILGILTYWSLQYILVVIMFISAWPFAAITIPVFSGWWVIVAYVCFGYIWYRHNSRPVTADHSVSLRTTNHTENDIDLTSWEIVSVVTTKDGTVHRTVPSQPKNIFTP